MNNFNGSSSATDATNAKATTAISEEQGVTSSVSTFTDVQTPPTISSSDSSAKTGESNSSGTVGTTSSADTVPTAAGSQELTSETSVESPQAWGAMYAMQPEFFQLDMVKDRYTFGRSKQCDYCFDLPSIKRHKHHKVYSKLQFAIYRTTKPDGSTKQIFLEDLGGTNGVYVNEDKVPSNRQRSIQSLDKIALAYSHNNIFYFVDNQVKQNPDLPLSFSNKYILHQSIGKGAFGEVFEIWVKDGFGQFACKVISKSRMSLRTVSPDSLSRDAMTEVKILQKLHHPCIIGVEDVIDSPKNLYIVLEFAAGGELFERLSQKGPLPERLGKLYFYQMLCAVAYLHENGITHRDLKPENVLLMSECEPSLLKITDFGMSKLVEEQSLMRTLAGTPSYLAPEIIKHLHLQLCPGYTNLVDMWSLGVLLYVCLVAYPPFSNGRNDTKQNINEQILSANFNFNHSRWNNVSQSAKQLISLLLKLKSSERLSTAQALKHPWLDDSDMHVIAKKLMETQTHAINFNLMGEKSLSGDSFDTRKVSTDADNENVSGDSSLRTHSDASTKSCASEKRAHEDSADTVVAKHAKVE